MVTLEELKARQSLSLRDKVRLSQVRIDEWYETYRGKVYVAFSGGKDSTVLLHLVRSLYPEVPAVFSNTGLEFPEIKSFVRTFENVTWVRPKLSFKEVIEKYGYPVISKDVARKVRQFSRTKSPYLACRTYFGNYPKDNAKLPDKWRFLLYTPFPISDECCDKLKKYPAKQYQKNTGRVPFIGTRADESSLRTKYYKEQGCNFFEGKDPKSKPLSFWKDDDIWAYIQKNNLPYSEIYNKGYKTTGCVFCAFGAYQKQRKTGTNQFVLLRQTHPKLWRYCMDNLGMREVLRYVGIRAEDRQLVLPFVEERVLNNVYQKEK